MDLKEIAAFGGLFLGLLNLGVTIYKEFGKKAKLEILESYFVLRNVNSIHYDLQLDIRLRSKNESIYIKEILLVNEHCFTGNVVDNKRTILLNIPLDYKKIELNKVNKDDFRVMCEAASEKIDIRMTDFKIEKGANKSISYVDRLTKPREMDGWEDFPTNGWSIKILYNNSMLTEELETSII